MTLPTLALAWLLAGAPVPGALHPLVAQVALGVVARDRREAREMARLAWLESRWRPEAVSRAGACGLWQVIPRLHGTTCKALQTRPLHSLGHALRIARWCREHRPGCWQRCYQRGPWHRSVLSCARQTGGGR